jgi:hypothetical protein
MGKITETYFSFQTANKKKAAILILFLIIDTLLVTGFLVTLVAPALKGLLIWLYPGGAAVISIIIHIILAKKFKATVVFVKDDEGQKLILVRDQTGNYWINSPLTLRCTFHETRVGSVSTLSYKMYVSVRGKNGNEVIFTNDDASGVHVWKKPEGEMWQEDKTAPEGDRIYATLLFNELLQGLAKIKS